MNLAFPIEHIETTKNLAKAVMTHNNYQIFTNVIHFQNLSLLTSKNHRAILQTDKMASLLKTLGVIPLLSGKKEVLQNLSLKDETLTYTDKRMELICRANIFMRNQHKKMKAFIAQWLELWGEVINLEVLVSGERAAVYMFTYHRS